MKKNYTLTKNPFFRTCKNYSRIFCNKWFMFLLLFAFVIGCKKTTEETGIIGLCPVVASTDPMDKAVDVVLNKVISATFNTEMDASTINSSTFTIKQVSTSTILSGKIAATANPAIFTFTPDVTMLPFTKYIGTVTMGATNKFRTTMVADYVFSFTTIPQITVSASPIAGGTVSGAGVFAQGSKVTVSAIPATGYTFTNWTDSGTVNIASTSPNYQYTIAGNRALVANFTAVIAGNFAVNLSSNPAAGGTTIGAGSYNAGSTIAISALPNAGYSFVNWTENGIAVSTSSSFQITALATNRTLVANFSSVASSQYAVVLSSSPSLGGTTSGSGAFNAGVSVTVVAAQNVGYTFTNWTDLTTGTIASTSASYTFVLSSNRN